MAEYIRVRFRFSWPLVASPSQPHQTAPNRRQIHQHQRPEIPDDICSYKGLAGKQSADKRQESAAQGIASVKHRRIY
jgi:hypothetical protein